jgi:7,8-dihydropterin-6-yl-methyl-4-(beta-D-ribofuranosyl)aminobenzene 5'-phosphate synthase
MMNTSSTFREDIKEAIREFGNKDVEETMQKILIGQQLSEDELKEAFYEILPWISLSLLNKQYKRNKLETQKDWDELSDVKLDIDTWGTIEHLEIIPLIDAKTDNRDLKTEHGVCYFVRADNTTMLFDVGLNKERKHPSPLLHNMEVLGVSVRDINQIFISHPHGDHCGGGMWVRNNTFGLSAQQEDLSHITAFTPTEMTHTTAEVKKITKPTILGKGIASIGPISQPMFFGGITIEQSLVINLKGKGLVIIVGCGHQSVRSIIDRTENIVDKQIPIYAFIGGVHLPIPRFPNVNDWMGIPFYKFTGTRRPIWEPWSEKDVEEAIESLRTRGVKIVSISTHDSSYQSIAAFRSKFQYFIDLRVGKPILF